jgi:hypothetical protein
MSGNATRLAVGVAGLPTEALIAARLIASFVAGVVLGSLVGAAAKRWRRPGVLLLVAGLLASATLVAMGAPDLGMLLVAAAMGAENTTFERDGEVSIGRTYMTGGACEAGPAACRRHHGRAEACLGTLADAVAGPGGRGSGRRAGLAGVRAGRALGRGRGGACAGRCGVFGRAQRGRRAQDSRKPAVSGGPSQCLGRQWFQLRQSPTT